MVNSKLELIADKSSNQKDSLDLNIKKESLLRKITHKAKEMVSFKNNKSTGLILGALSSLTLLGGGCSDGIHHWGTYAAPISATNYVNLEDINPNDLFACRRIAYTCNGGHIDIDHLLWSAKMTTYYAGECFRHLMNNEPEFSFKYQASDYHMRFTFPENWESLPENTKENIANEVSIGVGQYSAFNITTWHEIMTWFGYKSTGLYSEFESAFSWEDTYSNAVGFCVGANALRNNENSTKDAITQSLREELTELGIQPKSVAREAANNMRGRWYKNDFWIFINMLKRNFDIGLDDGYITPWLVPNLSQCENPTPKLYPAPNTDFLSDYGFSMSFEIEPGEWERNRALNIIYPTGTERENKVIPNRDFAPIMESIQRQAEERYGSEVGTP